MKYESNYDFTLGEPLHPCPKCHSYQAISWHEVDDSRPDGRRLASLACGCVVVIQVVRDGILDSELVGIRKGED